MTHRKIVNRMRKAQRGVKDVEIHNICVDAHNVHIGIWNQLQRYINQLTRKPGAAQ